MDLVAHETAQLLQVSGAAIELAEGEAMVYRVDTQCRSARRLGGLGTPLPALDAGGATQAPHSCVGVLKAMAREPYRFGRLQRTLLGLRQDNTPSLAC